ncbi:MAG: hypothetical protein ABEJ81_06620 [Haloferacaceae archaeon]
MALGRRELIESGGATFLVGLAGCSFRASSDRDRSLTPGPTPTPTPAPARLDYDIGLRNDHVRVTLRLADFGGYDRVTVGLSSDHRVSATDGFEPRGEHRYRATRSGDSPSLTYRIFAGKTELGRVWIGDGWAVTFPATIRAESTSVPAETRIGLPESGTIIDGNPIILLGRYGTKTASAHTGETFTVFAAGRPDSYAKALLPVLTRSSELLQWTNYRDAVRHVIIPTAGRESDSSPYGGGNVTIKGAGDPSDWRFLHVLVHEYLHLREPPGTGAMDWINEAVPEYYSALLLHEQGAVDERRFRRFVTPRIDEEVALTEAAGDRYRYRYTKGRRVLAALDGKIRRRTGGEHTLQQVFARVVAGGGSDLPSFERITADVAGHSFDSWIERYVTTTATPDVPNVDMSMLPAGPSSDVDDDGLPKRVELDRGTSPLLPNDGEPTES